jgi:hypothetical protein
MPNTEVIAGQTVVPNHKNEITVGTTAPSTPIEGDLWVDTSVGGAPVLKVYTGSIFTAV